MNLDNMIIGESLKKAKSNIKKVFFYRICGTGMGACACLAKEAGFEVAGADISYSPPMSTYLESMGIELRDLKDLTKEDFSDVDLIIVGNSVPRSSEFATFVEECGKPFTSFPSFLGEFILKDKEVIGLSGTHGKTTTTYFLAQMLEALGEDTGYFIGGIMNGRPPARFGKSKYFVIESDEYDSAYFQKISKFRLYELDHLILTSLEFDHADIFDSIEDIKAEFATVLEGFSGKVVVNDSYPAIDELEKEFDIHKTWTRYGETSNHGPFDIDVSQEVTSFKLRLGQEELVDFETNIIGVHNILNITSCILILEKLGFLIEDIQGAVKKLELVKRRQEVRGKYKGSVVIDDFAHHPRAVSLTIEAIKERFPNKKVITVFEPISATARSQIFQTEFEESLRLSDGVILAQNSLGTTVKSGNLDGQKIIKNLNEKGVESFYVNELSDLLNIIDNLANEENLFLILSNRTCLGLWESEFVQSLS